MASLESDAQERASRRKVREKEAQVIKEMGNEAFKENNFEKALEYYNQVRWDFCVCVCVLGGGGEELGVCLISHALLLELCC